MTPSASSQRPPSAPRSTCRRCGGIFRSCRNASTASRSSTSTTRTPARSRRPCSTRWTHYYRHANANIHRGDAPAERARDGALRRGPRQGRGVHQRARSRKTIVLTKGTTDGINLVAQSYGRSILRRGRRDRHLLARASLEHRPVADAVRADRARCCASSRSTTRGEIDLDAYDRAAVAAHADRRDQPRVERARHDQSRFAQIIEQAHARGRGRADRRRAGRAAPARSTCRRSIATSTRSRATRCSGRPASACSTAGRRSSRRCRRIRAAAT